MSTTFLKNLIRFTTLTVIVLLFVISPTQQSFAKTAKHKVKLKVSTKHWSDSVASKYYTPTVFHKKAVSYDKTKTVKTVSKTKVRQGKSHHTTWYDMTGSFYHTKGRTDLTVKKSVIDAYKFSAGISAEVSNDWGKIGVDLYGETSSSYGLSVTYSIDKNKPSGYYFFGTRAKMNDYQRINTLIKYVKNKKGKWVKQSSNTDKKAYAVLAAHPISYNWVKAS